MVILVSTESLAAELIELGEEISARIPSLQSLFQVVNTRVSDVVAFEETRLLSGFPYIEEKMNGLAFRIRPVTFFQTNTAAAEQLYRRIGGSDLITPESRVLGLYCGTGPIEIGLAAAAKTVTGIDSLPANISGAEENCAINGISNVSFVSGTVERLLKDFSPGTWDVVIVDPPRAGISEKGLSRLAALDVPGLIYVSCNAKTLARDLKRLTAEGYRISSIEPFDFFPHTPHLEILTFMKKD